MTQYPLRDNPDDDVQAFSGRPLSEITSEAIANGTLSADDLRIHASALRQQATIAQDAGYTQLASNLLRAAELTIVPNDEVLKIYEMLRPDRSSWDELMQLADYLEKTYAASENATFIREAAEVYRERKILRR
jgi:propanediol dehydratase small subunit